MSMIFASTLRSLLLLQASKLSVFTGPHAASFHKDLKIIAESKVEDFESALTHAQRQGAHSLIQVLQALELSEKHKAV